jgi:hypothetical protein
VIGISFYRDGADHLRVDGAAIPRDTRFVELETEALAGIEPGGMKQACLVGRRLYLSRKMMVMLMCAAPATTRKK